MRNNNKTSAFKAVAASAVLGLAGMLVAATADAAATIVILNVNAAGVGFNDPTPAAPVGGNAGITLGQQRLIAFQSAADKWGATITSSVPIVIQAQFTPLTCNATQAVLGSAGSIFIDRDFPGAPKTGTWYPIALVNKYLGFDEVAPDPQIGANFNSNLGNVGCLTGVPFYLGLDNNHGTAIDLVTVLLHEFGHGLGFQTFTNGNTGNQVSDGTNATGYPSIWDHFLHDNTANLNWNQMTAVQRRASALNSRKLVWVGATVTAAAPGVLSLGTPLLGVSGPAAGAATGTYDVGAASFGPQLSSPGVTGDIMPVSAAGGLACDPLTAADALAVNHNVALVNRGTCTFDVKALNAQNAGAIAVIVADNVAGGPPAGLGGVNPLITIPAVRITLADGNTIRASLLKRSRTKSGVIANLGVNGAQFAGADAAGRVMLFTPNPFQSGSSVSHWDTSAFPNLLMEPSINADLLHSVVPPADLTFLLLQDIGW